MSSRFWSPQLHDLQPYVPGEQPQAGARVIKLNTNENPYPPSPRVAEVLAGFDAGRLRLYPDPECRGLKQAISRRYGVDASSVFVGNGSDEVLGHAFMALFRQASPILFPDITYSFYPVYCALYGIDYERVPVDDDFTLQLQDYARPNGGIVLANPNAPTGMALSLSQLEALLQQNRDSVVLVDEAYVDFGAESAIPLTRTYDNLLVVQTLSKSRSLAGMRVGFAVGHQGLIEGLERVKGSFNSYPLDALAQELAVAALEDEAGFRELCDTIIRSRELLTERLAALGFAVLPSQANFLFVSHATAAAAELYRELKERGILVRYFDQPRIGNFLRITVGTDTENEALCQALEAILS